MTTESPIRDGQLAAQISNTVVRALSRTTGRRPTKAKTTLGANDVFVVLQDTLTRGQQTLADARQSETMLDLRHRVANDHEEDVSREIEELTGRKVIGFMSDNHIDPDLAFEVFVLELVPSAQRSLTFRAGAHARRSGPRGTLERNPTLKAKEWWEAALHNQGYSQDTAEKYIRRVRAPGKLISRVDRHQIARRALEVGRVKPRGLAQAAERLS